MKRPVHRETNLQNPNIHSGRWAKIALMTMFAGCFLLVGCQADTHKSLAKQQLKVMEDFVTILESVKDKRTATNAAPKLERIAKRMKNLKERADKLPQPSSEQLQELVKMAPEIQIQMQKVLSAQAQIMQNPEAMSVLTKAFEKIGETNAIGR